MFSKKAIFAAILGVSMSSASMAVDYPAVPVADLEAFFGTTPGAISTVTPSIDLPIEGSAIRDSFGFQAGDIISFDYNFMTDEVPPTDFVDDYAFVSINGQASLLDHVLGSPLLASYPYYRETGYLTATFDVLSTGAFDFGIGIVDVADGMVDSALLVDNIQVIRDSNVVFGIYFEDPFLDPYVIGDVAFGGDYFGKTPTEGFYQALITTAPDVAPVPLPPAAWLLFSGIAALTGFSRRKRRAS